MWLRPWLGLALFCLSVWCVSAVHSVNTSQTENLIDVLNYHPELSTFTHLLQRTRLLPTLNRIQELDEEDAGLTIFAPTNEAFGALFSEDVGGTLPDNVQAVLRQRLLYHVLNYTLPPVGPTLELYETLHLPSRKRLFEPTRPGRIPQKPQRPPEPGAEDHGGLLGNHGQHMRIQRNEAGQVMRVGVNARGQGGAQCISRDARSRQGILYVIDRVLDVPPPLDTFLKSHANTTLFRHINNDTMHKLATILHLTMFLPVDAAWQSLQPLEKAYLFSDLPQAMDDWLRLFGWHTSSESLGRDAVGYASLLRAAQPTRLTSILGGEVNITLSDQGQLQFGTARIVEEDILTENGVVHLVDGLHLPFGDLGMTLEKYLLALNATTYVALMKRAGLEHYINQDPHEPLRLGSPKGPFTFIVPSDDALERWLKSSKGSRSSIPRDNGNDIPPLREMLLYHILPGKNHDFAPYGMLSTELYPPNLQGRPQRIHVTATKGRVSLGSTKVIKGPIRAANAILYFVDDVARVPVDPMTTATQLSLTQFVRAQTQSREDVRVRKTPTMTYLVPHDAGFQAMGLVAKYLLHAHPHILEQVLAYHALPGLWYSDQLSSAWTTIPTWEGSLQSLRQDSKGVAVRSNISELLMTTQPDILTDTGVIHVVPRLRIPPSIPITLYKLAQISSAHRMMKLIEDAGFQWLWNETYHLELKSSCDRQKLVLLLPSDDAFAQLNLTEYYHSPELLQALVAQHILLVDDCNTTEEKHFDFPLSLEDEAKHPTLLDKSVGGTSRFGALALRHMGSPSDSHIGYMIGIKNARSVNNRHHAARITDFGRVSLPVVAQGLIPGGILTLDAVLEPYSPGWLRRWDRVWQVILLFLVLYSLYEAYLYARIRYGGYTRLQAGTMEGEEE
ncbi:hypothetical protein MCAP1_002273 [Malassezia caprae]|uniref:FAS1 domain-containing protein n=1 Tax=Malassezia caprae TaxID=1381934 RepID=A0AAF0E864_9BASI|nr:hypothetical protein MCAP1_002273 [Malassezia caprae]